jgi:hypothetical protein
MAKMTRLEFPKLGEDAEGELMARLAGVFSEDVHDVALAIAKSENPDY